MITMQELRKRWENPHRKTIPVTRKEYEEYESFFSWKIKKRLSYNDKKLRIENE